jgi:hypothetical protein
MDEASDGKSCEERFSLEQRANSIGVGRNQDYRGLPEDILGRNKSVFAELIWKATVDRIVPVVAQHEIMTRGYFEWTCFVLASDRLIRH